MVASCSAPRVIQWTALSEQLMQFANSSTIVVAHRGDSASHPENTIPAFESAVSAGAGMVELDFYQTKDGILVCFHDGTLKRTTDSVAVFSDGERGIADYTLAELSRLDAGSWKEPRFAGTRIPTLESALRTIQSGSVTMIEHKGGEAEVLVDLLRRMGLIDSVLVQSFDWDFLIAAHHLEPNLTLAALGGTKSTPEPRGEVLTELQRTHCAMVHWSFEKLTPEDVRVLHSRGYLVAAYTLNEIDEFDRAVAMGVDAITTDYPARLRAHIRDR